MLYFILAESFRLKLFTPFYENKVNLRAEFGTVKVYIEEENRKQNKNIFNVRVSTAVWPLVKCKLC